MSKKIRTEAVDYLFDAILSLKDKEECYTFFEDSRRHIWRLQRRQAHPQQRSVV